VKKTFKLADGTVGTLDTDTGDFTPNPEGTNDAPLANSPEARQLAEHPAPGLEHEDPIGDVIVGNAVAGGLPKLLGAVGKRMASAGANATTRLATRAVEKAAEAAAPEAVPASPLHAVGEFLHAPVKNAVNAGVRAAEAPLDRVLASPATARAAKAAAVAAGAGAPGGLMYFLHLLGQSGEPAAAAPGVDMLTGGYGR
jgi:hypothetical protein